MPRFLCSKWPSRERSRMLPAPVQGLKPTTEPIGHALAAPHSGQNLLVIPASPHLGQVQTLSGFLVPHSGQHFEVKPSVPQLGQVQACVSGLFAPHSGQNLLVIPASPHLGQVHASPLSTVFEEALPIACRVISFTSSITPRTMPALAMSPASPLVLPLRPFFMASKLTRRAVSVSYE